MPFFDKKYLLPILLCACLPACSEQLQDKLATEYLKKIEIEVTGEDFNWYYRYPGIDGILGTSDDLSSQQNLYLPHNSKVTLKLKSKDYIYSFALPEIDVKEIAVPDLNFEIRFKTSTERELLVLGDQFCGFSHKSLIGTAYVINQDAGFYPSLKQKIL